MSLWESGLPPPDEEELAERRRRVSEIQTFAQKILNDPEGLVALRRAGIGGDFTPEEREIVFGRSGLGRYMVDENIVLAKDYQVVAQALARRVAVGQISSVYAELSFRERSYERRSRLLGSAVIPGHVPDHDIQGQ